MQMTKQIKLTFVNFLLGLLVHLTTLCTKTGLKLQLERI